MEGFVYYLFVVLITISSSFAPASFYVCWSVSESLSLSGYLPLFLYLCLWKSLFVWLPASVFVFGSLCLILSGYLILSLCVRFGDVPKPIQGMSGPPLVVGAAPVLQRLTRVQAHPCCQSRKVLLSLSFLSLVMWDPSVCGIDIEVIEVPGYIVYRSDEVCKCIFSKLYVKL